MAIDITGTSYTQEALDAAKECDTALFGVDGGFDERLLACLQNEDLLSIIRPCFTDEPKFPNGAFITSCTYQKVTACWVWDNNTSIAPANLWPAAFQGDDQPGTIDIVTGNGNGGPEDLTVNPNPADPMNAQLNTMFADLAAQLTAIDPNGQTFTAPVLPAPNFRVLEVCTTDLSLTYGDIIIVGSDGVEYTLTPTVRFESECLVQGFVCNEDGTTSTVWQDATGATVEEPTAEALAEFQASKCPLPTTALPSPIVPDVLPDPVESGIELTKEDLGAIIQAEDGADPAPFGVGAVAVKSATRIVRG